MPSTQTILPTGQHSGKMYDYFVAQPHNVVNVIKAVRQ